MSTNQLRFKDKADQENAFKSASSKQASAQNSKQISNENAIINKKRPLLPPQQQQKRARVPLGGKDLNKAFPTLQRSQSSIPHNIPLRQAPVLARLPVLGKSNSSLGFTHKPAAVVAPPSFQHTNPHKNSIFPSESAHRGKELVPRLTTDSIKKTDGRPLPPSASLASTFSNNTRALHASNVESRELFPSVDPVKHSKGYKELLERLAEDPESIEHVSQRDLPLRLESPVDVPFLEDEDLDFIRTGVRNVESPLTADITIDFDLEDEYGVQNKELAEELETRGPVGLSAQDLDDLLDF